jgi:hypothetical protein
MDVPQPDDERRPEREFPSDFVIPDDLHELAAEVAQVRAELRRERRRARIRAVVGSPGLPRAVVLAVALLSALSAVIVVLLPPTPLRTLPSRTVRATARSAGGGKLLVPDVLLPGTTTPVPLRGTRPSVLLRVSEGCACDELISRYAAAAAPGKIRLVIIGGRAVPTLHALPPLGKSSAAHPIPAADPSGALAGIVPEPAPGRASAAFVNSTGEISRVLPDAAGDPALRSDLAELF